MKSLFKTNKAMSEVISGMLMIGLVIVLIATVWVVINNVVGKETKNIESCFGNFDKITINEAYTCYNSSSKETHFSINVGEVTLDELVISISSGGASKTMKLTSTDAGLTYLKTYPDTPGAVMPENNSGKTYILNMTNASLTGSPDSIQIASVIGGQKCQTSDSLESIEECSSL